MNCAGVFIWCCMESQRPWYSVLCLNSFVFWVTVKLTYCTSIWWKYDIWWKYFHQMESWKYCISIITFIVNAFILAFVNALPHSIILFKSGENLPGEKPANKNRKQALKRSSCRKWTVPTLQMPTTIIRQMSIDVHVRRVTLVSNAEIRHGRSFTDNFCSLGYVEQLDQSP